MRGWFPIDGTIKSGGTADEDTASVLKSTDFWTGAFLYKGGGHCVTEHRGMAMA